MKKAKVIFYLENGKQVVTTCEVAKNFYQKIHGLMYRDKLPKNSGMLFVYKFSWLRGFWMKNVKIPLDIIFVNKKLEVINIFEAPTEKGIWYKQYWSKGFCKYVIECNFGFCRKHGIKRGIKLSINIE